MHVAQPIVYNLAKVGMARPVLCVDCEFIVTTAALERGCGYARQGWLRGVARNTTEAKSPARLKADGLRRYSRSARAVRRPDGRRSSPAPPATRGARPKAASSITNSSVTTPTPSAPGPTER